MTHLTPNDCGIAPRMKYYSPPATRAHELFRCNEFIAAAEKAVPALHGWMASQDIGPAHRSRENAQSAADDLLAGAQAELLRLIAVDVEPGKEARAYAATIPWYTGLVEQIKARARSERWPGWEKA